MIDDWLADHSQYHPSAEQIAANIWRLTHQATGRSHRLKISTDKRRIWFLKQEAHWLERINYAGAGRFCQTFRWQDCQCLISDFIVGDTLASLLRSQSLESESTVKIIVRQCVSEIQQLHDQQVVHADIKPNNILWDGERIAFIDFANAGWAGQPLQVRQYHSFSPNYSHPELIESRGDYQAVFDWFSLIRVFAVLTGIGIPDLKEDRNAQWVDAVIQACPIPSQQKSLLTSLADELPG